MLGTNILLRGAQCELEQACLSLESRGKALSLPTVSSLSHLARRDSSQVAKAQDGGEKMGAKTRQDTQTNYSTGNDALFLLSYSSQPYNPYFGSVFVM